MTEREAILVLNGTENLDALRIRKLIKRFGSALAVLQEKNLFNFSTDKFLVSEYNLIQRKGLKVLTFLDEGFPSVFKDFEDAPVVLYVKGDLDCLNDLSLAIVGSRAASFYGRKSAENFARAFAHEGITVVSGLARGIDTAAHQGCLDAKGKTIAVMGCGFNYVYPQENHTLLEKIANQGAVVSEYACHMPPLKHNFPWRNRIISALSDATVVIEAADKSGALVTAKFAIAQNKDVFVVPSNIDNEVGIGSNRLMQDGAQVALHPADVLSQVKRDYYAMPDDQRSAPLLLSDEQSKVYPHITYQPVHLDELVKESGLNISSLMNITLSLELKRVIRQLPGQYYVRNKHA